MFDDSESVELTSTSMVSSRLNAIDINSQTHDLVLADAPQSPLVFVAGALAYDGEWSIYDQQAYDSLKEGVVSANNRVLNALRAPIWEKIKSLRDLKLTTGGTPAANKWWHSDTKSQIQQLGFVLMGQNIPPGIKWKTMDGTWVEMTPTVAGQIFAAAAVQDQALFAYAETLKAQVDASNDPGSIDITAGWPTIFGDL